MITAISVVGVFEQKVLVTPNHICIVYNSDFSVTYNELNKKANQLANYLKINYSIQNGDFVVLSMDRSVSLVVALFAILKIGAAYVAVDTYSPNERVRYMVEDSKAKVILTTKDLCYKYRNLCNSICIEELKLDIYSKKNLDLQVSLDSPAYIIYTSGTTGVPKGALIQHHGIINYSNYIAEEVFGKGGMHIAYMNATHTDLGYNVLFPALLGGKTLHIVEKEGELDIEKLLQQFDREQIDVVKMTPSYYGMLEAEIEGREDVRLQNLMRRMHFIIGGEALPSKLLREDRRITNHYGPTETTIGITINKVNRESEHGHIVALGKTITGSKIYVLDEDMNLMPIGAKGELYMSGPGIAIGYVGSPELTAEKFIANPFRSKQEILAGINSRFYRSGDIGRYLADGRVEFIGRKDDQVKIRGYRIELGEIEGVLKSHSNIKGAVVKAIDGKLIAYIVPMKVASSNAELNDYLNKYLPVYMLPSHYIVLDKLPLAKTGKVNRKALPTPDLETEDSKVNYYEPQNQLEQELCQIWQDVLGLERVGVTDNFFKLGGHSLLAIKLISRLRRKYGKEIKLISLFDKPTVKEFKEEIEKSGIEEERIVIPHLEPRPVRAELSFAQQRLWFLDKLMPDKVVYNMPIALEFKGLLDRIALKNVFKEISQRHEILRTVFKETEDGQAYQEILKRVELYEEIDLSSQENQIDIVEQYKVREANWKFDLSQGPLCRVKLLILNKEHHVLLITIHHIISDGWSINVLFEEVKQIYSYCITGSKEKLVSLSLQYVDYSVWQRDWFTGERLTEQLNYWQKKLQGATGELNLPTDRPRPKELTYEGGYHIFELGQELGVKVQAICEQQGVSLHMFLLAALNVLLYKLSGNDDIVVGVPTSGRHIPGTENLIGFFVNTLVMRSSVSGSKTFLQLLQEVRTDCLQSYQYQDMPFEKLVDFLEIERATNKNPIFQIFFDVKNYSQSEGILPDIFVQNITNSFDIVKFDLEFIAYKQFNNAISIKINYSKDLFAHSTIESWGKYYFDIVCLVLDNLHKNIGNIHITPFEISCGVMTKNHVPVESAYKSFETKVLEFSDSIAITDGTNYITYNVLNSRANQLACYLNDIGVGANSLISMCDTRSINSVVALIGILKFGGTYVPIDPNYPDERISFILNDSNTKVLITNKLFGYRFKNLFKGKVIYIDEVFDLRKESNNPNKKVASYSLAYLIYTSGTTGVPKGTMMPCCSLSNRLKSLNTVLSLSSKDKMLQQASLSFDISLQEILCTLISGATLYVLKDHVAKESDKLVKVIKTHQITVAEFIPSFLNNLLSGYDFTKYVYLSKVIVGGEAMPPSLITSFQINLDAKLINMYGPTELCMDSTYWICDDKMPKLGKAIDGTYAYVLDGDLNLVPFCVVGELYFASDSIAMGYLNRPELTAKQFIANPFGNNGERLYKTGDLVKWLPCGNLNYIGRKDFQVKIRGCRVEIEEIEIVLDSFTEIYQKAVVVKVNNIGNKYLVCYYSAKNEIDSEKLEEHLRNRLPEYMIPNAFIFLTNLPITVNGKIDRNALEQLELKKEQHFLQPRNNIEKELCKIWQEVLGIEKVSISDNFFRLGGDSILTIQVLSKSRNRGIIFNLKDIFDHPQIMSLSRICSVVEKPEVNLKNNQKVFGDVKLTPIQGYFFNSMGVVDFNHYNQSILLAFEGELNQAFLKQAIEKIIEQHDMLRARYKLRKDSVEQKVYRKSSYIFNFFDFSNLGDKQQILAMNNASNVIQKKINIYKNLVGVGVYRLAKEKYRIFIAIHHLVVDEVSWRIIKEDLEYVYTQLKKVLVVTLPNKTMSYKEWSNRLRRFVNQITKNELKYWKSVDNKLIAREQTFSKSYKYIVKRLDKGNTLDLLRKVNEAYRTEVYDILLIALALVLQSWNKCLTKIVDLEGHGRENITKDQNIDLSRTVGWFTTIYPLDLEIKNKSDLITVIKDIKERIRSVPNKGIGYGILKLYNKLDKHNQRADILFNFLGQRNNSSTGVFKFSNEPKGLDVSKDNNLSHKIVINCLIQNDGFSIRFTYDDILYLDNDIDVLANEYFQVLKKIVDVCLDDNNFGYTVSDFKDLDFLDQSTIDNQLGKIPHIEDAYRLSSLQAGFLFTENLLIDSDLKSYNGYIVQSVYSIEVNIDVGVLKLAWDILVQNNVIFRTGFLWQYLKEPIQFVVSECQHDFRLIYLKSSELKDLRSKVISLAIQEKSKRFDLAKPPINRVLLVLIDNKPSYLIWTTHHIILDGWTTSLLLEELRNIYISIKDNKEFIQDKRIVYKDYINWIYSQKTPQALNEWKNYLSNLGYNNLLYFGDGSVNIDQTEADSEFIFEINQDLSKDFRQSALNANLTPNTLFQAAFGLILHKYTELSDFAFGITVSGRSIDLDGISDVAGLCINTLPLRVKINRGLGFLEFANILKEATFFINQTSYISLAEIQKLVIQDKKHLFNTIFVYENYPKKTTNTKNLGFQISKFSSFSRTEYPFALVIGPGEKFIVRIVYNSKCFNLQFLQEFKAYFLTIMSVIVRQVAANNSVNLHSIISAFDRELEKRGISKHRSSELQINQQKKEGDIVLIDRNKQPAYKKLNAKNHFSPRNEIERKICAIWAEVLELPESNIGVNDDFFKLGGHSIKLIQLASRMIRAELRIPIRYMFQNRTIKDMSRYVLSEGSKKSQLETIDVCQLLNQYSAGADLVTIMPISVEKNKLDLDKLFIIHPGGGVAFPYMFIEKYINYCVIGINNPCFYQPTKFKSVEEMAEHYLNEIIKIQPNGPYNLAGYSFGGCVVYEISRRIYNKTNQINNVVLMDTTVDYTNIKSEFQEGKFCEDQIVNRAMNLNVAHSDQLSQKYKYKQNKNRVLFLKNKKNVGSLQNLCADHREVIIRGTHGTFLSEDVEGLTSEINGFLSMSSNVDI